MSNGRLHGGGYSRRMRAGDAGHLSWRGSRVQARLVLATALAAATTAGVVGIALGDGALTGTAARRLSPSGRVGDQTDPGVDCGDDVIVVLGNSTDYAAGLMPESVEQGWPHLIAGKLDALGTLGDVTIDNQAKPGATMATPNPWGVDSRWRWVTDIPVILDRYRGVARRQIVFVLAPSLIDLQVTSGDVMMTVAALDRVLHVLTDAGIADVVVLPMNPIAERSLAVIPLPDINARIAQFNAVLDARQLLTAYTSSPLIGVDPPAGDPAYYDDFLLPAPGRDEDRPDYLHIDVDGHRRIAGQLVRALPPMLSAMCAD